MSAIRPRGKAARPVEPGKRSQRDQTSTGKKAELARL